MNVRMELPLKTNHTFIECARWPAERRALEVGLTPGHCSADDASGPGTVQEVAVFAENIHRQKKTKEEDLVTTQ